MSVVALWDWTVAGIGLIFTARLALLVIGSAAHVLRRPLPAAAPDWPRVLVLIPAFNEEAVIEGSVRSVLATGYPRLRVVVIDDGSSDRTSERAGRSGDPRVEVLTLEHNLGKAGALNAGLAGGDEPVLVSVDADTVLDPQALQALVAPIALGLGEAVACNLKVGNRDRWLTVWQSLEYILGLNLSRRAQATYGCITTVPGAAAAFSRGPVEAVGGWSGDTTTEDTDLTLALLRGGARVLYQPAAVAFTEAPSDLRGLVHQRTRWMFGYLQCLYKHRGAFLSISSLGLLGMPNLLLVNLLAFPMLLVALPWAIRAADLSSPLSVALALLGWVWLDTLLAALSTAVDREAARDLLHAPLQRLVWPLFLLVIFLRVWVVRAASGQVPWSKLERTGAVTRPRVVRAPARSAPPAAAPPGAPPRNSPPGP
ncbi:MAG: glycosyltransferase family 2 protein [Deltaproteobacteria bacterium]|nr:glycosyltransferase family 2 protein [Deltaproteobacteria bacterium]